MANAARLEIDFPFGGKTYTLKPTFATIAGVEAATGMSCTALAEKFYAREPSQYAPLTLTATVIYALLRPVADPQKDFTPEYVGGVLLEDGCAPTWGPLGDFLSRALKGNKEHVRVALEDAKKEAGETAARPPAVEGTVDATSKTG